MSETQNPAPASPATPGVGPSEAPRGHADIVRFPRHYGSKGDRAATRVALKKEFAPLLGHPKEIWFGDQGDFVLAHAARFEPLLFPKGSDREGEERFDWVWRGPIEVGYRKEGASDADGIVARPVPTLEEQLAAIDRVEQRGIYTPEVAEAERAALRKQFGADKGVGSA